MSFLNDGNVYYMNNWKAVNLPGFVLIQQAGSESSYIRAGADEQQDDRQQTLEIKYGRLQEKDRRNERLITY